MKDPTVCAVMLVDGRPEMAQRAVASFDVQTYPNAFMLVVDSTKGGQVKIDRKLSDIRTYKHDMRVRYLGGPLHGRTIGSLRNLANALCADADIIAHFDSDDFSHPRRIEEQVVLLQASGKRCVGYNQALFWDTRTPTKGYICPDSFDSSRGEDVAPRDGDAWLYTNPDQRYVLGASMCYWRSAWEACPFDDAPHEDQLWWTKNAKDCQGVPGFGDGPDVHLEERIICQIHSSNTSLGYDPEKMRKAREWERVPAWDGYAAKAMKL